MSSVIRTTLSALSFAALSLAAVPALADPAGDPLPSFVAGGDVSGQNSTYGTVGVIEPLPGSQLGDGWVARVFGEEVSYRYKSGSQDIDGRGWGANASLGYQVSNEDGWAGLYAGPAYRHTNLSPNDPGNKSAGNKFSARIQGEGEYYLDTDFKMNGNASFDAFNNNAYWARVRALYRLDDTMFLGPEGAYMGDDNFKAWQAGLALTGILIAEKTTLGVDGGIRKTDGFAASPYGGVELGYNF